MLHWKYPEFIDPSTADNYMDLFRLRVDWVTFSPSPNSRLVQRWVPENCDDLINDIIFDLIKILKNVCHVKECSGVFMNNYINGEDYCPYHKDQYNCDVYTLSLGSSRDLLIKRDGAGQRAERFSLDSGDLYYMSEKLNEDYKHSIPKRKNIKGPRISLVFFCHTDKDFHPPVCDCWNCQEERKEISEDYNGN